MTQYIEKDKREDGTTSGMRGVEGYYKLEGEETLVRQINVYDVKTDEDAIERARADGLTGKYYVEIYLGEFMPCVLTEFGLERKIKQ